MNEQKNNGRGIFYGVIGVATLVVAIIGATFAYFTATAANNIITGNMATVKLSLAVSKVTTVDETKGGMIPMSNGMVEAAVSNASTDGVCVDNNGNAVCQVYKITLTNASSAGQFVDGYVALKGGSGTPTDYNLYTDDTEAGTVATFPVDGLTGASTTKVGTTMRWAQVFVKETSEVVSGDTGEDENCDDGEECTVSNVVTKFSTAGDQILGASSEKVSFGALGNKTDGFDKANIRTENAAMSTTTITGDTNGNGQCDGDEVASGCNTETTTNAKGILTPLSISGTNYNVIGTNYIRVSDHQWESVAGTPESYNRDSDETSALVFNHSIKAREAADYYVVVWLSETGTNQTAGSKLNDTTNLPGAASFFMGNVTFISAQGSEVSATFANHARVSATS